MHICLESITNLEEKIAKLEFDLNISNVTLEKFNVGSKVVEEIISMKKISSNRRGLRYVDKPSSSSKLANKDIFVKPKNRDPNLCKAQSNKGIS